MSRVRVSFTVVLSMLVLGSSGASTAAGAVDPWVTNGLVNSVAKSGDTVYLGGQFTEIAPRTGSGVALDGTSGAFDPAYAKVDGDVSATAADGSGGWYVGGSFTSVGGVARERLAHILPSGAVDPAWNPGANRTVTVLAVSGSTVYAAGSFTTVNGQTRNRLAAFDATSGALTSWNPDANDSVGALVVSASGSTVYAGGSFATVNGQARTGLAAISASSGTPTSWNPVLGPFPGVTALAVSGSTVYASGFFTTVNGQTRNRIAAISADSGSPLSSWNPSFDNTVYALAVSGSTVYAGGQFTTVNGQTRNRLAAVDATTGALSEWNPDSNSFVGALAVSDSKVYVGGQFTAVNGQTRKNIAAIDAGTGIPTAWNPNAMGRVSALAVHGTKVYAGGMFSAVNGETRNRLAAVNATSGVATDWNPNANNVVQTVAVRGSTIYAGGYFSTVGGQSRGGIAAIEADSGTPTAWNPNLSGGGALAFAFTDSTIYVGGGFLRVGGQVRNNLAAFDAETGALKNWNPDADSAVNALALSGSKVYAGGQFSNVNGQTRGGLAAIDASTGIPTPWAPGAVNAPVYAVAVSGTTVYAGGPFTTVGGTTRRGLAAITAATGTLTSFDPSPNGLVFALALSGSTLYAGGAFTTVNGQTRPNLAAIDTATGVPLPWNPAPDQPVRGLSLSDSVMYVGGDFRKLGALPRFNFAVVDLPDTAPPTVTIASPIDGSAVAQDASLVADFTCVDEMAPGTCTARVDGFTPVADGDPLPTAGMGTHTLVVTATDAAGNTATKSASYSVDDADPTVEITSPADWQLVKQGGSLSAGFSCADPGGIRAPTCTGKVDGGDTVYRDGDALPTASEGGHELTVTATDAAGRTATATDYYEVDGTAPTPDLTRPWTGGVTWVAKDAEYRASYGCGRGDAGGLPTCSGRLDGGTTDVNDGDFLPTGADGTHTLVITATDSVGNSATASGTYKVDGTDPTAAITSPSDEQVVDRDRYLPASFTCGDTGGSGIETFAGCTGKVDGGDTVYHDGDALPTGTAGTHTLVVTATDEVGRTKTASHDYVVDGTAPAVVFTKPTQDQWVAKGSALTADFACTDSGGATVASCTGELDDTTAIDDGDSLPTDVATSHTLTVRTTDSVGNLATETVTYHVDGTDPTATITAPTDGTTFAKSAAHTATFSCADAGSGIAGCTGRLDGTKDVASGDSLSDSVEASHTLVVTATDKVGRKSTATARYTAGAAPVMTVRPTTSAAEWTSGNLVTATHGDWSGAPTGYHYAWYRCSDASSCGPIPGTDATDDNRTYTLTSADNGFTLRVQVEAVNGAGSAKKFSLPSPVIGRPVLSQRPKLTVNGLKTGDVVTTGHGDWTQAPTGYSYEWLRCTTTSVVNCTKIPGVSGTTYRLTQDDDARRIRSRVTARNPAGSSSPATSLPTALIDKPTLINRPVVTGTAAVGQPLSTGHGDWTGTPTDYRYEWLRCTSIYLNSCAKVLNATGTTYTPTAADQGTRIRSSVEARNASGAGPKATSLYTKQVGPAPRT
ncbi:MAG TPA: hypothetical protein VF533_02425 [Solirubrobacteraceae bacterium]|jgi:hypothetical protein